VQVSHQFGRGSIQFIARVVAVRAH
jgi:hypothetical protein